MDLQGLLLLLQDNPAMVQGFLGGVIAAVLVHIVTWRWSIIRRKHNGGTDVAQK
jgi:cell division protein FtsX